MLTFLTVAGLVLVMVACLIGIVAIVWQTDWFSYLLWGGEAVQGCLKLFGICFMLLLECLTKRD